MTYRTYTAGQVYQYIWAQSQSMGQNAGLSSGQQQEFSTLAEATAVQESGLNPYAENLNPPTEESFGVYQDNILGGLGSPYASNPGQLFNPNVSAQVSLSHMLSTFKANPSASPGVIAAESQRPANPSAYAASVNNLYGSIRGGQMPVNLNQSFSGPKSAVSGSVPAAPTPNVKWYDPATWGNAVGAIAMRGAAIVVGIIIGLIGIEMLFKGSGGGQATINVARSAAARGIEATAG